MSAKLSLQSVISAVPNQVSCALGEEAAVLNLRNAVYYGLNPVGATVWNLLRQPRTIRHLRDALLEEYDVQEEQCERDLLVWLEKMRDEGLIQLQTAAATT